MAKQVTNSGWAKFMFNQRGYFKFGLRHDDFLRETPVVKEAVRRLPKQIQDERNYRCLRAVQASIQQQILPKEQWTNYEDDVRYLQPYIEQVEAENKEKEEWFKNH